jgi:hypothetical protein
MNSGSNSDGSNGSPPPQSERDRKLENQLSNLMYQRALKRKEPRGLPTSPTKRGADSSKPPSPTSDHARKAAEHEERKKHLNLIRETAKQIAELLKATHKSDLALAMAVVMDTMTDEIWGRYMTAESRAIMETI